MADRNRGKQSNDDRDFGEKWRPIFSEAADDLCFLLTRGYASNAAIQLVGNRYKLNKRQRTALMRIGASAQDIALRKRKEVNPADLKNQPISIDGFNLLILLESALSGAYILKGRDGLYRDMSSVHGSYKRVIQTEEAILMVGRKLDFFRTGPVTWYLDQPISNSGRLKSRLLELAEAHHFHWKVELVFSPDKVLAASKDVVISSDGWILDETDRWFNLGKSILESFSGVTEVIEI